MEYLHIIVMCVFAAVVIVMDDAKWSRNVK